MATCNADDTLNDIKNLEPNTNETVEPLLDKQKPHGLSVYVVIGAIMVLFALSLTLIDMAQSQYIRFRFSQESELGDLSNGTNLSTCTANHSDPTFVTETEIQQRTSRFALYLSLASNIPTIFTSLFLGAYSDLVGRKMLFMLPMSGRAIQAAIYAFVSYFSLSLNILFAAEFIYGLTGSFLTFLLACSAFMSDITTVGKRRTFYLVALDGLGMSSVGVSNIVLGYLIKYLSFTVPFALAFGLTVCGIVVIFFSRETGHHERNQKMVRPKIRKILYNIIYIYARSKGAKRIIFILCFVVKILSTFTSLTFSRILTIFLLGRPICWGAVNIGLYTAILNIVTAVGTVIFVKIAQRCVNDVQTALISGLSCLGMCVFVAFSHTLWHLYVAIIVGVVSQGVSDLMTAVMSKQVPHGEHGALYAGITSMQAFMLMSAGMAGNAIYEATVATFSGAVFIVIAGVLTVIIAMLIILDIIMRAHPPEIQSKSAEIEGQKSTSSEKEAQVTVLL